MAPKSVLITVKTPDDDWMLLRVSVICRFHMSKERAARLAPATTAPATTTPEPEYLVLETKLCETCGKSFLRVIGSELKVCAGRHSAPVTAADLQRLEEALLEGNPSHAVARSARAAKAAKTRWSRAKQPAQSARIRAAARG